MYTWADIWRGQRLHPPWPGATQSRDWLPENTKSNGVSADAEYWWVSENNTEPHRADKADWHESREPQDDNQGGGPLFPWPGIPRGECHQRTVWRKGQAGYWIPYEWFWRSQEIIPLESWGVIQVWVWRHKEAISDESLKSRSRCQHQHGTRHKNRAKVNAIIFCPWCIVHLHWCFTNQVTIATTRLSHYQGRISSAPIPWVSRNRSWLSQWPFVTCQREGDPEHDTSAWSYLRGGGRGNDWGWSPATAASVLTASTCCYGGCQAKDSVYQVTLTFQMTWTVKAAQNNIYLWI